MDRKQAQNPLNSVLYVLDSTKPLPTSTLLAEWMKGRGYFTHIYSPKREGFSRWLPGISLNKKIKERPFGILHGFGVKAAKASLRQHLIPRIISFSSLPQEDARYLADQFSAQRPRVRTVMTPPRLVPELANAGDKFPWVDVCDIPEAVSLASPTQEEKEKFVWSLGLVPGRFTVGLYERNGPAETLTGLIDGLKMWKSHGGVFQVAASFEAKQAARVKNFFYAGGLGEYFFSVDPAQHPALLFSAADVNVVFHEEGSWLHWILTAMGMAKPVFTNETRGTREIIENGVTGFVISPGSPGDWWEALSFCAGERGRSANMGFLAREKIKCRHDREKIFPKILDLYARLLNDNSPS